MRCARQGPGNETIAEYLARSPAADAEGAALDRMTGAELWGEINASVTDETERLVAYLCLVLAMKPHEVQARHPDRFGSVAEVYAVKRALLDRLRGTPAFRPDEPAR